VSIASDSFKDSELTIDQDALRLAMPPEVAAKTLEWLQKAGARIRFATPEEIAAAKKEDEDGDRNDNYPRRL
jgi:hypothetical protein